MRRRLALAGSLGLLSAPRLARSMPMLPHWTEPGAVWTSVPGVAADPDWSEDYFAVAQGAVFPRRPTLPETPAEARLLDAAWEAGIRTYLRRVSHTMGAFNHPDPVQRAAHRLNLAPLLHDGFEHTEGRGRRDGKGGFVYRTKPELLAAVQRVEQDPMAGFKLTGFFAFGVRARVLGRTVVVRAAYCHNQYNDPAVERTDAILMAGLPVRPRLSQETIDVADPSSGSGVILDHLAVDVGPEIALPGGGGSRL